jgi:hypothetical protein
MIELREKVKFGRAKSGRKRIERKPPKPDVVSDGRVPRISKLMALAIRFEGLLRDGEVADQSELAKLAHVTQPRMTQILNLLHLAPDIQEALLFLPRVTSGKAAIHEKLLRPIAAEIGWGRQRAMWAELERA